MIDRDGTRNAPGNHGHYTGKIQPIDFIMDANLPFVEGSALKYVCRYQKKNGLEDLEKADWYLDRLIERISNNPSSVYVYRPRKYLLDDFIHAQGLESREQVIVKIIVEYGSMNDRGYALNLAKIQLASIIREWRVKSVE